jgi:hypothetical protein
VPSSESVPDFIQYLDLTIYDASPQDLVDNALEYLQTLLPEWQPRENNMEIMLLEAQAVMVSEIIATINRLPGGLMAILLQLFDIHYDLGAPPLVLLRFDMVIPGEHHIPQGTSARLHIADGIEPVIFATDVELTIPAGEVTGVVQATGNRFTTDANNVPAEVTLELLDSIIYVSSVRTESEVGDGRDPEDDIAYFTRGKLRMNRLTDALSLPRHYEAFTLENPIFTQAQAVDNWDNSVATPGTVPGWITVVVYGAGRLASTAEKSALQQELQARSLVNLGVLVIDPILVEQNVDVSLVGLPEFTVERLTSDVDAAIRSYLDPSNWPWSQTLRRLELATVISNVVGVDYIITLTEPVGDVALTSPAMLITPGDINIDVIAT